VELADRRTGSLGTPIALRNVNYGWILGNGLIATRTSDDRIEILDLDGSALVEQPYDIDPIAKTSFNAGLASVVRTTGHPEVVNLATGERSTIVVPIDERESFLHTAYPDADGWWLIDDGISRWAKGAFVARLDLSGRHLTGTRHEDLYGRLAELEDGTVVAQLINLDSEDAGLLFMVDAPESSTVVPSLAGGLHVMSDSGTLTTYDSGGDPLGSIETGAEYVDIITLDPTTGHLAVADIGGGVVIVDTSAGIVDQLPAVDYAANLGFGRNGEILVITGFDGTVRLWDVERSVSGGLAWNGTGSVVGSPSWYDDETESIWVATSGKLLRIPLNPQRWIERACEIVGQNLTQEEWDRHVPGDGPLQAACPNLD
jgi:hypothetical protein